MSKEGGKRDKRGTARTTSASWPFSLVSELDLSFWLREDFSIASQPGRGTRRGRERYRGRNLEEWAGHWVLWKEVVDVRGQGCMQPHGTILVIRNSRSQGNCQYDLPSQQEKSRVPFSLPLRTLVGSCLGLQDFGLDPQLSPTRRELSTVYWQKSRFHLEAQHEDRLFSAFQLSRKPSSCHPFIGSWRRFPVRSPSAGIV